MNPQERELRRLFSEKLADAEPGPLHGRARRRIAVGRSLIAGVAGVALALAAYGGFALTQSVAPPDEMPVAAGGSAQGDEDPPPEPRPVTPKVEVATGRHAGEAWSVFAYRAMTQAREGGAAREEEALCVSMDFGPSRAPDATCAVGLQEPFADDDAFYAVAAAAPEWTRGFFGTVSKNIDRVELRLDDGTSYLADIRNGGSELRVPFNFFVGFVPQWEDVTVVAVDRTGRTVETQRWPAPPVLRVVLSGDGSGSVTGTRTEEVGCSGCEPHKWIDCGLDCTALINDASVTLEARPEEGSIFEGWDGACSGVTPCVLQVDADKLVRAIFRDIP